jgi:hypothetical protein
MNRVRLSSPSPRAAFSSSSDHIARITFAWIEDGEPVVQGVGPYRAVVVVWPTDARGYVDVAAVRNGQARVTTWDLSERELDALRELVVEGWNFERFDLMVTGGPWAPRFMPAVGSLRRCEFMPHVTEEQLERLGA